MEAVRTSETSVDNRFTRQYIPEDNSEHLTYMFNTERGHNTVMYSSLYSQSFSRSNLEECEVGKRAWPRASTVPLFNA
jgi:hypothetical protein